MDELKTRIAELQVRRTELTGAANKKKRNLVNAELVKLEQDLANAAGGGPAAGGGGSAATAPAQAGPGGAAGAETKAEQAEPSPASAELSDEDLIAALAALDSNWTTMSPARLRTMLSEAAPVPIPVSEKRMKQLKAKIVKSREPQQQDRPQKQQRVGGAAGSASDDGDGDDESDEFDERPELKSQIDALKAELGSSAPDCTAERRREAEQEVAALEATVSDLDKFEALQDELDELDALKGAKKKAAQSRIRQIEKELDTLEEKHRAKTAAKMAECEASAGPARAPEGVVFLTMATAKSKMSVIVTGDEAWAKHQCGESTKTSKGRSTLFWDNSANGKARKAALGQQAKILEMDKSDHTAKIRYSGQKTAWFPVAALSAE